MTRLIYATNTTLDGYIEDASGAFDFFPVDDEVFAAHTDLMRSVGTLLYGRRLYEAMAVWETDTDLAAHSPCSPTSPQPGERRARSSTPGPWPRSPPPAPGSNRRSPLLRCGI
ncbi:hypothetical protein GCM10025881_14920 [Pseudolysinimonas kribbensis]|uniref:Bacterial bifunctional deaminase-reductase C-terminal domain-containing protein n=1 Tax=Pseudolysinimonas kribbensis TaxID=433641 RepID=A0ABQ6K530_9MICO|nr:hypothetical protein [Pseudolysinimonas kribbensis]GMA94668.1 hypothetical protein GCM10025881_14920 [Pseudolysinimonas kribbensis]